MSKAFASATYSRQQTCPILVTKNCVPYWDQQTFRKIREISADFMSPIVVSTNFFSVLYWSQKTQNNKIIDICCKIIQTSCNIGMNSEFFHFLHMLHKVVGNSSFFIYRLRLWELLLVNIFPLGNQLITLHNLTFYCPRDESLKGQTKIFNNEQYLI